MMEDTLRYSMCFGFMANVMHTVCFCTDAGCGGFDPVFRTLFSTRYATSNALNMSEVSETIAVSVSILGRLSEVNKLIYNRLDN